MFLFPTFAQAFFNRAKHQFEYENSRSHELLAPAQIASLTIQNWRNTTGIDP